jgi:hypothetical protein
MGLANGWVSPAARSQTVERTRASSPAATSPRALLLPGQAPVRAIARFACFAVSACQSAVAARYAASVSAERKLQLVQPEIVNEPLRILR